MEKRKIRSPSRLLKRPFHTDLFVVGDKPRSLVLFFGGSGIDEDEYRSRERSIIPVFDAALSRLEDAGMSFGFVYVTAPFDVPFARFSEFPADREKWCRHVLEELLPAVQKASNVGANGRHYLAGFSGGAVLALSGVHMHEQFIGAGFLGADGIPGDLELPSHWRESIGLYYNANDPVFFGSRAKLQRLAEAETVAVITDGRGTHQLGDYLRNGSFEVMVRSMAVLTRWSRE